MRRLVLSLLTLALLAGWTQKSSAQQPLELKLGYPFGNTLLVVFVADELGIFTKNNLKVTHSRMPSAGQGPTLLVAGTYDIVFSSLPTVFQARENGIDMVVLAVYTRNRAAEYHREGLVARKNAGINGPADLVGKKVGVPAVFSAGHLQVRMWLDSKGVDSSKIQFVEARADQMADLLKNGTLDAALTQDPIFQKVMATGDVFLLGNHMADLNPDFVGSFFAGLRGWAEKNPEALKAFRKSLQDSIDWMNANPEEARKMEAKIFAGNVGSRLAQWGSKITEEDIAFFNAMTRKYGLTQKDFTFKETVFP